MIRVAQIGTSQNSHGNDIFRAVKTLKDDFEFAGYAFCENEKEKFPERATEFTQERELTVDEILSNPEIDAVLIETEEKYLTKYALMAAKAGKHIHMEKPGGFAPDEFEKLIDTVKANEKVFHMGYMYRYNPEIQALLKRIKSGELGKIFSVEAQMNCYHSFEVRKWLESLNGGMMFFLGCHLIDLMLQIKGKPEKIYPFSRSSKKDGAVSRDMALALFEYPEGISIIKAFDIEVGGYARRQLVVTGEKETVEINPLEKFTGTGDSLMITKVTNRVNGADWSDCGTAHKSPVFHRYIGMMKAFASYVRKEKENPYSPDYEFMLYKTILECCGENE